MDACSYPVKEDSVPPIHNHHFILPNLLCPLVDLSLVAALQVREPTLDLHLYLCPFALLLQVFEDLLPMLFITAS